MEIVRSLYLILPGLIANLIPPLVKRINFLNYPLDFGLKIRNIRIFGDHKTFRGLFFGLGFGIIIALIQYLIYSEGYLHFWLLIDFNSTNWFLLGFLIGFGALFGDVVKSFFKRRMCIASGKPWIPFDQLDFVVGMLLFLSVIYVPNLSTVVILMFVVPLIHIATNHVGFYLGINKKKW